MFVPVAAMTFLLCLCGCTQPHADTSRPRPNAGVGTSVRISDSLRPADIEAVEVIKRPDARLFFDRIGPTRRRAMLDTLEAQRRLWTELRPRAYLIRLVVINECISTGLGRRVRDELLRDRLLVRDTSVVGREPAPLPARYEHYCPRAWRVDDLFADVAHALADTSVYIMDIQYDAAYGFPRSYFVEQGRSRGDRVIVESFAPTP
jgi:Family of unknown function (DUF6174)